MEKEDITKELLEIADSIKDSTVTKINVDGVVEGLRDDYREFAYDFYTKVCGTMDEKGKPIYTNEDMRRREVNHKIKNDDKASNIQREMKRYRDELGKLLAEINRLQDRKIILLVTLGAPLPEDIIGREDKYAI